MKAEVREALKMRLAGVLAADPFVGAAGLLGRAGTDYGLARLVADLLGGWEDRMGNVLVPLGNGEVVVVFPAARSEET